MKSEDIYNIVFKGRTLSGDFSPYPDDVTDDELWDEFFVPMLPSCQDETILPEIARVILTMFHRGMITKKETP